MPEFEDLRDRLRQARGGVDASAGELASARHRLRRISSKLAALDRVFNQDNRDLVAERRRLLAEQERTAAEIETLRGRDADARGIEAELAGNFAKFTDPRDGIARLSDSVPILMMPVRLETRFKDVRSAEGGAVRRQLWVRVYPDDCWIDSFDPDLTDTEIDNARNYWTEIWEAGGIPEQERGAWRGLVASHGSGRAAWILDQYKPTNLADEPGKSRAQDVVLTIRTEAALPQPEVAPTIAYWKAAWLADGDAAAVAAARANLVIAVGGIARADEIIANLQPVNFAAPLAEEATKAAVNVQVAFLVLPTTTGTKAVAWSRAPRMNILPDRFVFIGYGAGGPPLVHVGKPVPSPLFAGPDPSAAEEDQLQNDDAGDLVVPDELKWMSDFDRAVDVGMGFRIDLDAAQAADGFRRIIVLGLRLNANESAAKDELQTLLSRHAMSRKGLSVVPQGTPTNNSEAVAAGHSRGEDSDDTFNDRKAPLFTSEASWLDKKDGQWIAEYLGIDPGIFAHVHAAGGEDQLSARAMNAALWSATLGYWMQTMMAPAFPADVIERTRQFFSRFVVAPGAVPAIRIGPQPYGIMPATAFSRMNWLRPRDDFIGTFAVQGNDWLGYLRRLHQLILAVESDWHDQFATIPFVGKAGDPHDILLDIVGLHSGSVEWSQRYAESLRSLFNRLNMQGFGGFIQAFIVAAERAAARHLATNLGYGGSPDLPILEKVFNGSHQVLKGGVVDDRPLSESELIRVYTDDKRNYIQWLIDAAGVSIDALYAQDGFVNDKPPTALLYILLRHALQLGYHDVSIKLHESVGLYTAERAALARSDDPFLHIKEQATLSESRYQPLYAFEPVITGSPTQTVGRFIGTRLNALAFASDLREQLAALERLKRQPTARLERAFADHMDCCAYRLDAWMLGIVNYQLALMRNISDGEDRPVRQGVYLGAYAWLEELKPENKQLTPVRLEDPGLLKDFTPAADPPLMRDSTNEGYIHAPSLNHAVAAAVLRNGYLSDATPANRETLAVNLTSERVRTALALLEGVRAGQSLADLLGYQFERGLHDRHGLAEVDKFTFKLRKAFPLRADRMNSTRTAADVPIEAVEARNVVDGLLFVEHMKSSGDKTYPFGKGDILPHADDNEAKAINLEAERLLESHDAVADLALSEGVYQAVLGNYDRVASTYDAYARGNFPPEPDVVRTPLNGTGLIHRVGLHLEAGADPTVTPLPGVGMTPRAQAEPGLNRWLAQTLPPPDQVACLVTFRDAATAATLTRQVTLADLKLQLVDLLAIVRDDNRQMTELDDRIDEFVVTVFAPRPDVPVTIEYLRKQAAPFSVFQLMPLLRNIRQLTTKSRPLKATDLALAGEAKSSDDSVPFVNKQRLDLARNAMQTLRDDFVAFRAPLEALIADPVANRGAILAGTDATIDGLVALLKRAACFVVPQSGWGFAYDFRRRLYAVVLKHCADLVLRWDQKLIEFADAIAASNAAGATVAEQFQHLRDAERAISTAAVNPLPPLPATFRNDLNTVLLPAFTAKRVQFDQVKDSTRTGVVPLLADVAAILPIAQFDFVEFSLTAHEDEMIRFTEDGLGIVNVMITGLERRLAASLDLFGQHDASANPADRVAALEAAAKALLGEDFRVFPEFSLGARQGTELENALSASRAGTLFQYLTAPPDPAVDALDFPIDTWLYGVARVRDKMHALEQSVILTGSLGRPEPVLDVMQLPYVPDDRWLALEFPPDQILDKDRLLYTALFAGAFDKTVRQCGLLLDEWSEVIPGTTADTGIAFHYDRPSTEAPQSMLLVTPSQFRGAWVWEDVVDALNETLDFAKRRAIEPKHIDRLPYAPFLPATIMASQVWQLTIAANLAINNNVTLMAQRG